MQRRKLARLLLIFTLSIPLATHADGPQTGIVAGVVVDSTGEPVEGVPVTLTGPQGTRDGVTDASGRFRFPALGIGSYTVEAELLGLTDSAPDQPVYINRITEVRLELQEPQAEPMPVTDAWIQVVAEAPVIDKYRQRLGAEISRDFLDQLPVQRFYQSVALLLPGIEGGEDGNPNVSGALRGSNLFLIDGVDTTDPTTGLFGLNLAYEAIRTVDVATAAAPVEYGRASGAILNVVTGSGSNHFQGNVRFLATNRDWDSDYERRDGAGNEVLLRELAAANSGPDTVNPTLALSLGGPLAQDRVWFFVAFEDAESAFARPFLIGNPQGDFWDEDAQLESAAVKLNARLTDRHSVVAQHTRDDARFTGFNPFSRGPSENRASLAPTPIGNPVVNPLPGDPFALQDERREGDFTRLQWNGIFTADLSVEAAAARQERRLDRSSLNSRGLTSGAPHAAAIAFLPREGPDDPEERFEILEIALFNGITDVGREERPRDQANIAANLFFQRGAWDHEIRAGIDFQETESLQQFNFPGVAGVDRATGRNVAGQLFLDIDLRPPCVFFLQDCEPFNPGTGEFFPFQLFNFWSRPERITTETTTAVYVSDTVLWGKWLFSGGVRWERVEGDDDRGRPVVDDDIVTPRFHVTYDSKGDGTVLLSAGWGRYGEPFLQQYLDAFGRADLFTGVTEYSWGGLRGLDCDRQDPTDVNTPCWIPTGVTGFQAVQGAAPNPGLDSAFVDEWVLGFERRLTPNTGLGLFYVDRRWEDLWDNVLGANLRPDGEVDFFSTVDNLEIARRRYKAVQLLVQKRFADRWQLMGSYTFSEDEGNLFTDNGLSTFADFLQLSDVNVVNRFGLAPFDRKHRLRIYANVQVPISPRINLSVGNVVRLESGTPFQQERLEDVGVRFLTPRGSERLDTLWQWDVSLLTRFRLTEHSDLELKVEIFNLTDEGEQIGVETNVESGRFGGPRTLADFQAPRSFRLTAGWRF